MKKIKVLHFELSDRVGGIETFLFNVYRCIDRNKVQFDFITIADTPALGEELEGLGGRIYRVSEYKHIFKYYKDIVKIVRKNDYDIIHIHKNSATNIIPIIAAKQCGKKVIVHAHNTLPSVGKIAYLTHMVNRNFMYKNCIMHLACSTEAGEWLYGNKKFAVIHNGIDLLNYKYSEDYRNEIRQEFNILKSDFVIGNVGRFENQKNQARLIEIFKYIHDKDEKAKLLIVGDGKNRKLLMDFVDQQDLGKWVIFAGIRKDVYKILSAIDCFVMPSLYEGLPIAAVEAQAAGCKIFLADTISKETELTEYVKMISFLWEMLPTHLVTII